MFTGKFWKSATERAIKSAGQFGLFAWGTTTFTEVGDVAPVLGSTLLAILFGAGISYLTSIATVDIGDEGSPSAIKGGV